MTYPYTRGGPGSRGSSKTRYRALKIFFLFVMAICATAIVPAVSSADLIEMSSEEKASAQETIAKYLSGGGVVNYSHLLKKHGYESQSDSVDRILLGKCEPSDYEVISQGTRFTVPSYTVKELVNHVATCKSARYFWDTGENGGNVKGDDFIVQVREVSSCICLPSQLKEDLKGCQNITGVSLTKDGEFKYLRGLRIAFQVSHRNPIRIFLKTSFPKGACKFKPNAAHVEDIRHFPELSLSLKESEKSNMLTKGAKKSPQSFNLVAPKAGELAVIQNAGVNVKKKTPLKKLGLPKLSSNNSVDQAQEVSAEDKENQMPLALPRSNKENASPGKLKTEVPHNQQLATVKSNKALQSPNIQPSVTQSSVQQSVKKSTSVVKVLKQEATLQPSQGAEKFVMPSSTGSPQIQGSQPKPLTEKNLNIKAERDLNPKAVPFSPKSSVNKNCHLHPQSQKPLSPALPKHQTSNYSSVQPLEFHPYPVNLGAGQYVILQPQGYNPFPANFGACQYTGIVQHGYQPFPVNIPYVGIQPQGFQPYQVNPGAYQYPQPSQQGPLSIWDPSQY
jgi:hypothetical protein